jgi:hypothetical protein
MRRTRLVSTVSLVPLLLLGLVRLAADTTPIIELSKDDSAKAQAVYENLTQMQQAYTALERQMYRGYVKDSSTKGFSPILFTVDFRFLVGSGDPAPTLELSKEDTATLQAAYNSLRLAQQSAEAFRQHIVQTYLGAGGSEEAVGNPVVIVQVDRTVFRNFRYTQDYRFILPN